LLTALPKEHRDDVAYGAHLLFPTTLPVLFSNIVTQRNLPTS
jgi:hypothetical protein